MKNEVNDRPVASLLAWFAAGASGFVLARRLQQ